MSKTEVGKTETYVQEGQKYGVVDESGRSASNRWHMFNDCSTIRENKVVPLTTGEVALLGLRPCTVCDKRASGGPAVEALEGFFGEDWPYQSPSSLDDGVEDPRNLAWKLQEYLREKGFYIAKRQPKSETNGKAE